MHLNVYMISLINITWYHKACNPNLGKIMEENTQKALNSAISQIEKDHEKSPNETCPPSALQILSLFLLVR